MKTFNDDYMPPERTIIIAVRDIDGTPIKKGDGVVNLFEIRNMEKHIAFIGGDGKIYWGYHPDNFKPAEDEDL